MHVWGINGDERKRVQTFRTQYITLNQKKKIKLLYPVLILWPRAAMDHDPVDNMLA